MKLRWALFPGLIMAVFFVVSPRSEAVSQNDINLVLGKQVLDQQDLAVIDTFLAEAIDELVKTRDFTEVAQIRAIILSKQAGQGQYNQQFSQSARKHLGAGIQKALTLPEDRQTKVLVNLLILVDRLQDVQMADLSLNMLTHPATVVRYWAVRSLANPAIVAKMKTAGDSGVRLIATVADRFRPIVRNSSPEMLALMAQFAGQAGLSQTDQLLITVADARISAYNAWAVKRELVDSTILKTLAARITAAGPNKNTMAQRFAQLLSCAMQRTVKGGTRLTEKHKNELASVLVEVEDKALSALLGSRQTAIRRAFEGNDYNALQSQYNILFGQGNTPGQLVTKVGFNFGQDPSGRDKTNPIPLPDPPPPRIPQD